MVSKKTTPPSSSEDTPERLVAAAVKLFAAKGFDGTSVKELAAEAGVNVSLVSDHFGGKDGLYRHCFERFGKEHLELSRRLLQPAQTIEEFKVRLEVFIGEIFNCHKSDSNRSLIIFRECDLDLPMAVEAFQETFLQIYETLSKFISTAQKKKMIRNDLESDFIARHLFGSLVHFMRSEHLSQRFFGVSIQNSKYQKKVVHHLLQLSLYGLIEERKLT
jgi:AcrR family transcriptional regulator